MTEKSYDMKRNATIFEGFLFLRRKIRISDVGNFALFSPSNSDMKRDATIFEGSKDP
jgi:hypothetical protein